MRRGQQASRAKGAWANERRGGLAAVAAVGEEAEQEEEEEESK